MPNITKKILIAVIMSLTTTHLFGETLEGLIQKAISYSQSLQVKHLEIEVANETVKESVAEFLPRIEISGGVGSEISRNPTTLALQGTDHRTLTRKERSANIVQNLFSGWRDYYQVKASLSRTKISQLDYIDDFNNLILNVVEAFYETIRNQELLSFAQQNLKRHEYLYKLSEQQAKTGLSRKTDLQLAKERIISARKIVLENRLALYQSKHQIELLTGTSPTILAWHNTPNGKLVPHHPKEATAQAINTNPKLRSMHQAINEQRYESQKSISQFFPEINLELTRTKNSDLDGLLGPNEDKQVMLRGRYTLFNGGKNVAEGKKALLSLYSSHHNYVKEYRNIRNQIYDSWRRWNMFVEMIPIARSKAKIVKLRLQSYQNQFKLGARTIIELFDVEIDNYFAQTERVNVIVDESIEKYRLLFLTGHLPQAFNLGHIALTS